MSQMFYNIIGSLIMYYSLIVLWSKLLDKKINYKEFKLYISWLFLSFYSIFNSFVINKLINITLLTVILMITVKFLFNSNLQKSIVTPIFSQLLAMVLEAVYAVIFVLLKIDVNLTINSPLIKMLSNIIISLIIIYLSNRKLIRNIYDKLISITDKISNIQLSSFCILVVFVANILTISCYYTIDFKYLLPFNIIIILICFVIVLYSLKTQNNYNKVNGKYSTAIRNLKIYGEMLNNNKIKNHENKNQLLTIRAMSLKNYKSIPQYIDSILDTKYKDDDKLFEELAIIAPESLRATLYSEIIKIKNRHIKYTIMIDKNINTEKMIDIDINNIVEICKILGVFIDNAIEEVDKLKNKEIGINFYVVQEKLNIKISNNYSNKIDINKISNIGYTTKGKDHGYGLALVKSIVEKNPLLENSCQISKNIFSQILTIKY